MVLKESPIHPQGFKRKPNSPPGFLKGNPVQKQERKPTKYMLGGNKHLMAIPLALLLIALLFATVASENFKIASFNVQVRFH